MLALTQKEQTMSKRYIITCTKPMSGSSNTSRPLTVAEAVEYYSYTLEVGASWAHEKGNKKINRSPTTIRSLLSNLNNASNNAARNGCGAYYTAEETV
jgi:hypothetical protein